MHKNKTPAVIFDMDGTLSDLNGRKPYGDAQADCDKDLRREHVIEDLLKEHQLGRTILIVSGRFRRYTDQTQKWLDEHGIPWDEIYLRGDEDTRQDEVIKQELYEDYIEPFYDVVAVWDDRPKVIRMWQALGLHVNDVGYGIEF